MNLDSSHLAKQIDFNDLVNVFENPTEQKVASVS